MAKFRRFLIILSLLFIFGAFICSFFMQTYSESSYSNYKWHTYYYQNEYGSAVVTFSLITFIGVMIALVFSFFNKRKLYVPSLILNAVVFFTAICSVVFSGVSISRCDNEGASICATVFSGISIFALLIAVFLGLAVFHRLESPNRPQMRPQNSGVQINKNIQNNSNSNDEFTMSTVYDDLKKAKELLDCGAITQEEYDNIKKRILKQ